MLDRVLVPCYRLPDMPVYPYDEWLINIRHWAKLASFYRRSFGDCSPEYLNAIQYMSYYISLYRVYYYFGGS